MVPEEIPSQHRQIPRLEEWRHDGRDSGPRDDGMRREAYAAQETIKRRAPAARPYRPDYRELFPPLGLHDPLRKLGGEVAS